MIYIAAEVERVGAAKVDTAAIVRRFVALGASKSRIHTWIGEAKAEATDERRSVRAAAVKRVAAAQAAQSASMLEAEMVAAEVAMVAKGLQVEIPPAAVVAGDAAKAELGLPALAEALALAVVPGGARTVLAGLQKVNDAMLGVLAYSHTPDGKVRNAKLVIASADALRRCLTDSAKLYASVNNMLLVERFMMEVTAVLHRADPAMAMQVVEGIRAVQARWAA